MSFLAMPEYSAQQLDRAIGELIGVVEGLRGMSVDTMAVRLDIDRLLRAYGRKLMELNAG